MAIKDIIPWKRDAERLAVRRAAMDPFLSLQAEMNRIFDRFYNAPLGFPTLADFEESFGTFVPQVDVSETDKEIKVSAELPGMDEKDIDVALRHDALAISGEKKSESVEKDKGYYRSERSYGSFRRTVSLSAEVDADKVEATFRNGVLTITLPKTAQAISKRIQVKKS